MANIKKGTKVVWRGAWGREEPQVVSVESIEYTGGDGKEGEPIETIPFEERENCVFDLNNGHWCYGSQIVKIVD